MDPFLINKKGKIRENNSKRQIGKFEHYIFHPFYEFCLFVVFLFGQNVPL
jgi:hypothetical protein